MYIMANSGWQERHTWMGNFWTLSRALSAHVAVILVFLTRISICDEGSEWTGGLPGTHDELRFDVPPGRGECFFIPLRAQQNIHVAFEVLRGGDRSIDLVLHAPTGQIIDQRLWVNQGNVQAMALTDGDYRICVDNSFSRFTHKLVYMYIIAWREDDWHRHARELEKFAVSIENVTISLRSIDQSIQEAHRQILFSGSRASGDRYSLLDNSSYVQNISIFMCCIIVATSGLQVFFVKRLFNAKNVTPNSKPRA